METQTSIKPPHSKTPLVEHQQHISGLDQQHCNKEPPQPMNMQCRISTEAQQNSFLQQHSDEEAYLLKLGEAAGIPPSIPMSIQHVDIPIRENGVPNYYELFQLYPTALPRGQYQVDGVWTITQSVCGKFTIPKEATG
ncbi:hypothetical protein L211DRAFT_832900, partial [Terfezia boudieri ATCC MYA-4762]